MRFGWLLGVALAALTLVGCGLSGGSSKTYVGPISVVSASTVCIAGPQASGECFVKDGVTQSLRLGQCVQVTYPVDSGGQGPATPSAVALEDAAAHRAECPSPRT